MIQAQFPAMLTGFQALADKSVKITISTKALNHEQAATLLEFHGSFVGVAIAATVEGIAAEAPKEPPAEGKSWSKRMRDRLYVLHTHQGGKDEDFEMFYARRMQTYLNDISNDIDSLT